MTLNAASSVELRFNNVKKFETTDGGVLISGHISGSGNIQFSGSFETNAVNNTDDFFLLKSGSMESLKVNGQGVLTLGGFTFEPTAVKGGMYYNDSDDEFYAGKNN